MTKKNLLIVILLLAIIDLVAGGWYVSRRIEASGKSQSLFGQRDSTEVIAMADTVGSTSQADVFDKLQHNTFYFISNSPSVKGDNSTYYTSTKHVKVRWPKKINGDDDFEALEKELIKKAFGNTQSVMKDARYVFLNTPEFNKPIGDDYHSLVKAPTVHPVYGNVSQVLVYPYMTSNRLLVMEIDKSEYNGSTTQENSTFVHYDRLKRRVLSRLDILVADASKESKLLKAINKKIDNLNQGRADNRLQHALNVPTEICCGKKGIIFQFKHGTIADSPIEVMIDYDKMENFMTEDFKQLVMNNDGYKLYKENIAAEPINPKPQTVAKPVVTPTVKKSDTRSYKKKNYNYKRYKNFKPKRTRKRGYSGARHRSGHHGYSGKRHWNRRRY